MRAPTESRRRTLRSAARIVVAAALGALVVSLGLRRRSKQAGYCHLAGRCGSCTITAHCTTYQATQPRARR